MIRGISQRGSAGHARFGLWRVRQGFFHEKIGQEHAPALHLVFPQEPVTPAEKERPGGQGGIGVDPVRPGGGFQGGAQGAGHTLALAVFVDVQPVQVAGFWPPASATKARRP